MGGAIGFQSPHFHFAKALTAKLGLTAQWLLRHQAIRPGRAGVDFVLNQVGQFEHGNNAHRYRLVKGRAIFAQGDVLEINTLQQAKEAIHSQFGDVDILINAAGGNHSSATTKPDLSFFDLPLDALEYVSDLNLLGTILPCQIFGRGMAERGEGVILNVSSMNAVRPLTRIPAYSAAKAAVSNFTQWLAVHMAQNYSPRIRVNAIAPGFFITEQNRFLLTDKDSGELTARGQSVIAHTPMNRFGTPEELLGATMWLISPAAAFVTGTVIPIDGGFSAFSGV